MMWLLLAWFCSCWVLCVLFLAGLVGLNRRAPAESPSPKTFLIICLCWLVSLTFSGCADLGSGPSKAIPIAKANVKVTGDHIVEADNHAKTAQTEVREALPLAGEPAVPHLTAADNELTETHASLTAATKSNNEVTGKLTEAETELKASNDERDKYKSKYEDQWFAGKFWKLFWTLLIVGSILAVLVIFLNIKTDLFVVPFQHIGKWLADMVGGTVRAFWNVCKGVWSELASLFKKATPPAGGT